MTPDTFFAQAKQAGAITPDATLDSAYQFGADPQTATALATLVLSGQKTATTSGFALYRLNHEPLPATGELDIILDGAGEPVALTVTTAVTVQAYAQVGAAHAAAEGEGDGSLAYWRRVHDAFFTAEYQAAGLSFDPATALVVLEHFRVIYRG
ncbi:ASCH domain-containing protein [Lacticaseibacillus parakribbianus]|uniref:ASCH domain-containing protein n=1 Tax=Lacticaseibacillus parakribbianus TaxID=2970927 RepID=UPI0021CB2BC5|nr:ASCH domain-containing protein [Lacticaseibacillus parakribbianus]